MISSSQMPCAGSAIQSESLLLSAAICVAMSPLRAVQPGSTRSINTYVKTDASFKQRRTETEIFMLGGSLFPLLCSTDWSKSASVFS